MSNYTFNQVNNAVMAFTPCYLVKTRDELGEPGCFSLRDGCDEQMGDLFYELDDVVDYVTNNEDVRNELEGLLK